ncbi:senescence-associated carboxylesterase [Salix suchowensis]|nr:senescence-associated carboxylesterase [Salix suchowensis]
MLSSSCWARFGKLVVSADLLQLSCGAVKDLHAETNRNPQFSVRHKIVSQSNCTIIAFAAPALISEDLILQGGDLVSSSALKEQGFPLFESLCSEGNPSFSVHGGAITLFKAYFQELSLLKDQLPVDCYRTLSRRINCFSLHLWLLDNIKQTYKKTKLPLCFTFGSPLLGDQGLQRAISERSKWCSCFLHCKPFGTFFFCSEFRCNCVDDPEVVSRLLESTASPASAEEMGIDDYSGIVNSLKSRLILREDSQIGQPVLPPLRLGIILQLKAAGVEITAEKLNRVKINMACLEWYKKNRKTKGTGYYDSYKNLNSISDFEATKFKKSLTHYWRKLVEEAERKPQKEGAFMRETWLYAGTNYRRMVEPLDIAEFYRQKGKRDYQTHGRSKHYILLEQWQKDSAEKLAGPPNDKKKQNVAGNLTEDSCFWMNVEEALISCKQLKDGSTVEKQSAREFLNKFEQYVMDQINNYAVSPEIFLEKSSFMKWWIDFQEIIETSHDSPLRGFMTNCRYRQYEKGLF